MKYLKFFIFLSILSFTVSCGQQKKFIEYKVKEGETMSKIAQKLNIKSEKLIRLNPDVVGEPKANSYIIVPQKTLEDFKSQKESVLEEVVDSIPNDQSINEEKVDDIVNVEEENFEFYEVIKGDTFYNIDKRFGVTKEELLLLNPELSEGLELGMIIKIREKKIDLITNQYYNDSIAENTSLKAALLLPFKTYKYEADSLTLKDIFVKDAALLNIATDFYLGAEIAIDSLRNKGLDIEFNVYDTGERNSDAIPSIISDNDLDTNDVIIGPLYSSEVQMLANTVSTPIVFPVYSKKQSQFYNSNIIKTSPNRNLFREELVNFVKENFEEGNIIVVNDSTFESTQNSNFIKTSLIDLSIATNITASSIKPNDGYIAKERFLELLQPNINNWVVIATNNQVIASDAINSLISLPEETTARVFALDKGKTYDKIDNSKLASLNFTYVSDEFEDVNSINTKVFNDQYLKKNNTLPSYYATKGFDITYDILVRLASGKELKETFKEGVSVRVESKFDYRNSDLLSENKGIFIIKYNEDLSLEKLR